MRSVMSHQFSMIPSTNIQRSVFDRSHGYKTTLDEGFLIPFLVDEVLPGDTFQAKASIFCRLATPIFPIMDNMFLETFYFFVPNRLIWKNWQEFMGELRTEGLAQHPDGSHPDHIVPSTYSAEDGWYFGSIHDYMGLPPGVPEIYASSLPLRAYYLIWNEWFRDENFQDPVSISLEDGIDGGFEGHGTLEDGIHKHFGLMRRGKRHDYFTSCLPWPQKGAGVDVGLMGHAPVFGSGKTALLSDSDGETPYGSADPSGYLLFGLTQYSEPRYFSDIGVTMGTSTTENSGIPDDVAIGFATKEQTQAAGENDVGLFTDLDLAESAGISINSLRQAFQIQKMLERDARGGTRYTEIIRAHFGVISPDARLQRPEFLGGSSCRVNINPVQQTSSSDSTSPQGNLAAYGLASDMSGGFSKSFTEHGIIIGLINIRADLTYQQGINRMFSRTIREEYYWPELAHIGEQAVYNREIMVMGPGGVLGEDWDSLPWGFQERYAEYRYFPSLITGKMRSSSGHYNTDIPPVWVYDKLDAWHLSQNLISTVENPLVLGDSFIRDTPPVDRVVAVPSEPHFILDAYFSIRAARPMPLYGVPGMMDHF